MKLYTKTGDDGTTGLFGAGRVRKDAQRIRAYGDIDELNSVLGVARSQPHSEIFGNIFDELQRLLFILGADLATPMTVKNASVPRIIASDATDLEAHIDRFEAELPPLTHFVLPGGSGLSSALHHARTVARRAEREIVTLADTEEIGIFVLQFINRLSDLLFAMARYANVKTAQEEIVWSGKR